jgi:hypothetical protein
MMAAWPAPAGHLEVFTINSPAPQPNKLLDIHPDGALWVWTDKVSRFQRGQLAVFPERRAASPDVSYRTMVAGPDGCSVGTTDSGLVRLSWPWQVYNKKHRPTLTTSRSLAVS